MGSAGAQNLGWAPFQNLLAKPSQWKTGYLDARHCSEQHRFKATAAAASCALDVFVLRLKGASQAPASSESGKQLL